LANKEIQTAVAAYTVNQLFSSGVPQARLKAVLPPALQGLAGPITGGLQQLAGQVAPRILASPQVQTAWREANRAAHATLVRIINGDGSLASTHGGAVTLNLSAIVRQLAATLGVQQQVAAAQSKLQANAGTVQTAASKLGVALPASTGQLVILRSNQLKTVQDVAGGIRVRRWCSRSSRSRCSSSPCGCQKGAAERRCGGSAGASWPSAYWCCSTVEWPGTR
jgi:hypothetical protein